MQKHIFVYTWLKICLIENVNILYGNYRFQGWIFFLHILKNDVLIDNCIKCALLYKLYIVFRIDETCSVITFFYTQIIRYTYKFILGKIFFLYFLRTNLYMHKKNLLIILIEILLSTKMSCMDSKSNYFYIFALK